MVNILDKFLDAVFFDVDGVLTSIKSSWRYIHKKLGVLEEADKYKKAFIDGKITYEEWMRLDTELWIRVFNGKLHRSQLHEILSEIKPREGAKELFVWLHRNNIKIALISCGVEPLVDRIARTLGADIWMAPRLKFDKKGYLLPGGIPIPAPQGHRSKGWAIRRVAWELGVSPNRSVYIGDDLWDLEAFKAVAYPIAFEPSHPILKEKAFCTINSFEELMTVLDSLMRSGRCQRPV